jgi:Winged helix DNA-binding domain
LATRHRLLATARTDDVAAIADSLVALHSTDPATVYLSAMARMKHPSIEAVSRALYDDRTVVRHHAMRRTLWVFTPQMARWAHAACTVAVATTQWKRLSKMVEQSGVATDGAAWATVAKAEILAALTDMGTATARQVGQAVPALTDKLHLKVGNANVAIGGAHTRLLLNLGFEGAIVRGRPKGSWTNSEYPWSVVDQWLVDGLTGVDVETGVVELARNYLARFGPASTADLQWWAGWTAGTTKRALAAIDAVEVELDAESGGGAGWVLPDDTGDDISKPWIAFLPALDPTTMGWKNRSWYLGDLAKFGSPVFDVNGNAGPTIWVDGRVVGGWAQRKSGDIAFKLLADVPSKRLKSIGTEAERLRELIGEAQVNVRFPAPMQKELLA